MTPFHLLETWKGDPVLSRRPLEACACVLIAIFLISTPFLGDEHEPEAAHDEQPGTEHGHHRNHFGGLIGVSTHSNTDDMGPTIGLEYARMLSKRFALAGYVEMVSGRLERDVVVAAGLIYYQLPRLGVMPAPGLGPAVFVDWASDRWTSVFDLGMTAGF
jgi:hypothetical protein